MMHHVFMKICFPCHIVLSLAIVLRVDLTSASAQDHYPSRHSPQGIIVTGECLSKIMPDRGSVVVGSTTLSPTSKEASEKAIKAHEALKTAIKALHLPDFSAESTEYSVDQECSYHEGKRTCQGYRARLSTRFETSEIARLGDVIAASSNAGAEDVSGLSLFASQSTLKSAREACLESAMKDAAAKASKLASGANVRIGKLISVIELTDAEGQEPSPFPRRMRAAAMSEGAAVAPSVESKPLDLRVQISAQYSIE